MNLSQLPKTVERPSKRLGQGHGSGRGKTGGRGTKGQKARTKIQLHFEGGALPLTKRLPFRRGKGRNKVFKKQPVIVNVKTLSLLPPKSVVDIQTLVKHNIVDEQDAKVYGVKILGEGEVSGIYTVKLPISKSASEKITKAGGVVEA